jgi:hypothetical protein
MRPIDAQWPARGEAAAMFGKSESGQATIVARQMHEGLYKMKAATGVYRNIWDYIADVVPDNGGEPFRATFTEIFEGFQGRQPAAGEQAPVTFNKKREVKLDRKALHEEWEAAEAARKSGFEAIAEAPPGTPAAPAGRPGTDFAATMAAIAAARKAGDLREVERLKAEFAAHRD